MMMMMIKNLQCSFLVALSFGRRAAHELLFSRYTFVFPNFILLSITYSVALILIPFLSHPLGQFTEDGSFIGQYVPGKLPVSPLPIAHSQATAPLPAAAPGMHSNSAATYV